MSVEVHRNWFARIKWWDNKVEAWPVSKIKKFHPKSLTDFDPNEWYRVKGNKESYVDGVAHSGWALIGLLTETVQEAENPTKRIAFPPLPPPCSDPDSTSTETEKLKEKYNQNTINQQDMTRNLNRQRKMDHINSFKNFEANFLNKSDYGREDQRDTKKSKRTNSKENEGQPKITSNKQKEKQDQQMITSNKQKENQDKPQITSNKQKENQDQQKIAAMEQKIKQLEEELKKEKQQKKRKSESPTDKAIDEYVAQINKVCEQRETALKVSVLQEFQLYQQNVEAQLEKIHNLLSKSNGLSNFKRTKQWVESQSFTSPV